MRVLQISSAPWPCPRLAFPAVLIRTVLLTLLLSLLLLCSSAHASAGAGTTIPGGTIAIDTTWSASGSPYIVTGDIAVGGNATLTLEPGVTVKFSGSPYLRIQSGSALVAEGTAGAPITITTNNATPVRGSWQYILFEAGSRGRLRYCTVEYAGVNGHPTLYVDSSDLQVRDCTLRSGHGDGVQLRTIAMTPLLQNVTIASHDGAAVRQIQVDMSPTYSNLTFTGNGTNGVVVPGGGIGHSITFDGSAAALNGSPYILTGDIAVAGGYTLTFIPGTTIRWAGGPYLRIQNGASLVAEGTAGAPITITTYNAMPAPASWQYILFEAGSRGRLRYCTVEYAGVNGHPTLYVDSSDVQVRDCTLRSGRGDGVQLRTIAMTPLLQNVTIAGHGGAAVRQIQVDMSPTYSNLTFTGNGTNGVVVPGGGIGHSITFDGSAAALNGSPYILTGDIAVAGGYTLTLTPGTTIRWAGGPYLRIQNGASLVAAGTAGAPITITTNNATPAPGSWQYIMFEAGSRGRLRYCAVEYAGANGHPTLYVDSSDVQVRDCTLRSGRGDGVQLRTIAMTPLLQNVTIAGHGGAAVRQTQVDMSPTYSNLTFTGNGTNGVVVPGGGIGHSITFDGSAAALNGSPYILTGDIAVAGGYTLTLTPGTTIRWAGGPYLRIQNGASLVADGTAAAPITITTNNATPAPGSWQYIMFEAGSHGRLAHCTVQYAGVGRHPAFYLDSSDVRLFACTISSNQADDIRVRSFAQPLLVGNRFAMTSTMAMRNERPETPVDATQQWWGDPTGPFHADLNPAGKGAPVSSGVLFDPWLAGPENSPPTATVQEPAAGALLTRLPVTFRFVILDSDTRQPVYARLELLRGGTLLQVFDQSADATGWDATVYGGGQTAILRLPNGLAKGSYQWRLYLNDGFGWTLVSDLQPFSVDISGPEIAATDPDVLVATAGVQTVTVRGMNFAPGIQLSLTRSGEAIPLAASQYISADELRMLVDLDKRAGMLQLSVQQGAATSSLPLPVIPYWPLISLQYHNGAPFSPGRNWEHQVELQNLGNAPGVAVIGILPPAGVVPSLGAANTWDGYVGAAPGGRTQVIAVLVNPGETRYVRLLWQLPWANVIAPDLPYVPGKVRIGDGLRFRAMLLGSPSPAGWAAVQAAVAETGDGIEGIVGAAWVASGMPASYVNQQVETLSDADLNAYLAAATRVNPWLADALFSAYLDTTHIALINTTGITGTEGAFPLDPDDLAGMAGDDAAVTEDLKSWIDWTVGDPHAFWKAFVTGYRDPNTWAQSGAFLVGEVEGFVEGVTFGLWKPNFGGDALAHLTGLPPSALTAAKITGNVLSIPTGNGVLGAGIKTGGKMLGHGTRFLVDKAKPLITYAAKYTGRLRPTVGGADELYRVGFDWMTHDGVSKNLIHWGANGFPNTTGGAHLAIGSYGQVKTLANGQKILGAGPHLYADKLYLPHLPPGQQEILFSQYSRLWTGPAAVARTGVAGINAVYPDEPSACNQGSVTVVASYDPNDISGFPPGTHVLPGQLMRFQIQFENMAGANLPAEDVTVNLRIPEEIDWDSILLNGSSDPELLQATLDKPARTITWFFDGIQLPPNETPPEGEGWVEFAAAVRGDLLTGAAVALQAHIVFDANPPIDTPVLQRVVDVTSPAVDHVTAVSKGGVVTVGFAGADNDGGSGLAGVTVYASSNGTDWAAAASTAPLGGSMTYTGTLQFSVTSSANWQVRLVASDALGNQPALDSVTSVPVQLDQAGGGGVYLPFIER